MTYTTEQEAALLRALAVRTLAGPDFAAATRIVKNARLGRTMAGWQDEAAEIIARADAQLQARIDNLLK